MPSFENPMGDILSFEQSATLLRDTLNCCPDMIQVLRAVRNGQNEIVDFACVLSNKAAEIVYGDVTGKNISTFKATTVNEEAFAVFKKVVETGEPSQHIFYYPNGRFNGWLHQSVVKQDDGVTTFSRNITAEQTDRQNMQHGQAFLKAILDTSLDVIQVFDAIRDTEGKIIDFAWKVQNKNGIKQNGAVAMGDRLIEHNPGVIPAGIFDRMVNVVETGIPSEEEQYYCYEQFNDRWFYQALAKQDDGVLMTTRDITQQKKAEREVLRLKDEIAKKLLDKYYSIFNTIDEGLCIFEMLYDENDKPIDYRFIEVNPTFESQTGLKDVIGKTGNEVTPVTEPYWLELYDTVIRTGEATRIENYHAGTERWYHVNVLRIGDESSRLIATVFEDATERKRLERNQSFLAEVSKDLVELDSIAHVVRVLGEKIGRYFDVKWCVFTEPQPNTDMHLVYGWNDDDVPSRNGTYKMHEYITEEQIVKNDAGELTIVSDTQTDPTTNAANYAALDIHSFVLVPYVLNKKWKFQLAVIHNKVRFWRDDEIALLKELTSRIWIRLERARAEDALRESETKYRTLFDTIDEGFGILEAELKEAGVVGELFIRETNQSFEKKTNLSNVIGRRVSELLPGLESYWMRDYLEVIKTGVAIRKENYMKEADRWFSVHFSLIGAIGSNLVAVVFDDITERKHREQHQDFLLKLSDAIRPITDAVKIENTACRLLGEYLGADRVYYPKYKEKEGYWEIEREYSRGTSPSMLGKFPAEAYSWVLPFFRESKPVVVSDIYHTEIIPQAFIGAMEAIHVAAVVSVPLVKNNEIIAALSVTENKPRIWKQREIDIVHETEERTWAAVEKAHTEQALRDSEQQLKQLLKLRDEFISIASHELKTPVTSMKAYAQIVKDRLDEIGLSDEVNILDRLNTQINRLTSLINDLLDTTRISEGKLSFDFQPTDLNELLNERIEEIRRITGHVFNLREEPLSVILADKERIGQVITNLLSNAIKYSPNNSTVTITTRNTQQGISVWVKDEGVGVSEEDQQKIFDRFYRVISNEMRTYPGMGLGLYISAQIIHRHGGSIGVNSKPGKGSEFYFTIPYKRD